MPINLKKYPELFDLYIPSKKPIGVISIPHSGELIPQEFFSYLTTDHAALREDIDFNVFDLIDIKRLNREGIIIIVSKIHRFAVDLNRAATDAPLNWKENTKGIPIVVKSPIETEINNWVLHYHTPYYKTIYDAIKVCQKEKGEPVPFVDLHSMPSKTTDFHLKKNPNQRRDRPDFCLSDLVGQPCSVKFMKFVESYLVLHKYKPLKNDPYQGGNITQYVNSIPETNNIQIEINRELYLNEETKQMKMSEANHLKHILTDLFIHLFKEFAP